MPLVLFVLPRFVCSTEGRCSWRCCRACPSRRTSSAPCSRSCRKGELLSFCLAALFGSWRCRVVCAWLWSALLLLLSVRCGLHPASVRCGLHPALGCLGAEFVLARACAPMRLQRLQRRDSGGPAAAGADRDHGVVHQRAATPALEAHDSGDSIWLRSPTLCSCCVLHAFAPTLGMTWLRACACLCCRTSGAAAGRCSSSRRSPADLKARREAAWRR